MKTCAYLYGVDQAVWHDLPYDAALILKNRLAQHVIDREFCTHSSLRDMVRVTKVLKAIKFNEKLLAE